MNRRNEGSLSKWVIGAILIGLVLSVVSGPQLRERMAAVLGFKIERQVVLIAVGDVMLGRSVNTTMQRKGDFRYPFLKTAEVLAQADVTLGNLEAPLVKGCPWTDTGMRFCGDPRAVAGLKLAGFDVLSLANNHVFNYGESGFEETKEVMKKEGIIGVGEGEWEEIEVEGVKIGFIAVDDVSKRADEEALVQLIKSADYIEDVVIVSVHWGGEYRAEPTARQKRLGRAMIDGGADVVVGHHPHWIEPVEEYNDGYIFYSLGNFVFDQMWSEKTREGVVARIQLTKEGVNNYELLPVKIYDYAQPRWMN